MKRILLATLAWGLIIAGCSDSGKEDKRSTPSYSVETITQPGWLHENLPNKTVAYVRLPNLWGFFSAKEDSLKYALGNQAHVKTIKQIQQGISDNVLSKLDDELKPAVDFYFKRSKGPLEVAFVNQNTGQPMILAGMTTDFKDVADLNKSIQGVIQGIPNATVIPGDSEEYGFINFSRGLVVYYHYDDDSQHLTLITGMGASITSLEKAAELIKPNANHEMQKLEQSIDASHEGLFVWVSPKNSMSLLQMGLPPEKLQQIKTLGVDQANGLAFGYGVSDGKSRLKLLLDMPEVGVRQFIPTFNHDIDFKTVGEPDSAFIVSWPSEAQVNTIIDNVEKYKPGTRKEYEELLKQAESEFGLTANELFILDGPGIVRVSDEVGAYWVWKHNPQKWAKMLEAYQKSSDSDYEVVTRNGLDIHHLTIAGGDEDLEQIEQALSGNQALAFGIYSDISQHMYWVEENGYMIYSTVPQVLIERAQRGPDTQFSSWMKDKQGIDYSNTILTFTTTIDDISRTSYHYYLELINQLGDLSGAEIDLLSLPTAGELGLPDEGTVGLSLTSGDNLLGLEFTFENGASDVMLGGGGVAAVAVIGIMAAVAIPAYQDYTLRSETQMGVSVAEVIKLQIQRAMMEGAKMEDLDNGYAGIKQPEEYYSEAVEKVVVNDGVITIFFNNPKLGGYGPKTIVYAPVFEGKRVIYWDCTGGSVAEKHRPARCK